ncbi:response regulator [Amphritea japonica]|uniref:Two-component system response regulator n=1 Tax=Amphritea japonica ATCC BAA-1530 TaxID=1278309 RepID=A0A7R6PCV5_9GAMM|nr:response regulator [Amphritea japonica]BBB25766.1 two-component system response regulator [Amphritea japonica ATCC BAA-1530]
MKTLTSGDIANYLDVTQRTVIRWINSGQLKGFKLPGRGNNRIQVVDFIGFLKENGMPIPDQLQQEVNSISANVLLIDDEPAVIRAMTRALKPLNQKIYSASDGFHAGLLLQQLQPAIVVLDLNMPGMDGFSVIRHIRDEQKNSTIRILVVSALADQQLDHAIAIGADAVLSKPFSNAQLRKTISEWLDPTVGI